MKTFNEMNRQNRVVRLVSLAAFVVFAALLVFPTAYAKKTETTLYPGTKFHNEIPGKAVLVVKKMVPDKTSAVETTETEVPVVVTEDPVSVPVQTPVYPVIVWTESETAVPVTPVSETAVRAIPTEPVTETATEPVTEPETVPETEDDIELFIDDLPSETIELSIQSDPMNVMEPELYYVSGTITQSVHHDAIVGVVLRPENENQK